MYLHESSPTLTKVTFSGNLAVNAGGGMLIDSSSSTLIDVTFSDNSADYYGGGMALYNSSNSTLTNTILWGNSPEEICFSGDNSIPIKLP